MKAWGKERSVMPQQMQNMAMPSMDNVAAAPVMHLMSDPINVPPMNLAPPMPLPLIVHPDPVDIMEDSENIVVDSQKNDVSSSQSPRHPRSRHERDLPSSNGRNNRTRSQEQHERTNRERQDRNDRDRERERNDRGRYDRERKSKWENNTKDNSLVQQSVPNIGMGHNMMMPGAMQYPNMMSSAMQHMEGQLPGMMNMMGGMMPTMMDQNMMMINPQDIPLPSRSIYINGAVLLPPLPDVNTPPRREKPKGCRTIFIGGIQHGISLEALTEIFQRFGNINDIKMPRHGVVYIRFEKPESVEQSFFLSGYRMKFLDQAENEATTIFVDYALNRDDQSEYEKKQRNRDDQSEYQKKQRNQEASPPRFEPVTATSLNEVSEKIRSEDKFAEAAPTLAMWLERGECNKKNVHIFYSLIQASNNQIRRLYNEKMSLDEEFQNAKAAMKDKFSHLITQFEQIAKILSAAKHQRVSDHFTKQQRKNIEIWLKMTEELEIIKEEFCSNFDEEETERVSKHLVSKEKYEELKKENENLMYELEGYKNEVYLAKDEAEKKFEKFKIHFIAQQALENKRINPPLPEQPMPPSSIPDDNKVITSGPSVPPSEAKLVSILTAFLMVHPLGASLDYLVSYVRSMTPNVTQGTVLDILQKYNDVFLCKTSGIGATIDNRWGFVTFDVIKNDANKLGGGNSSLNAMQQ